MDGSQRSGARTKKAMALISPPLNRIHNNGGQTNDLVGVHRDTMAMHVPLQEQTFEGSDSTGYQTCATTDKSEIS